MANSEVGKEIFFKVTFTEDEFDAILRRANSLGRTVAEFVQGTAVKAARRWENRVKKGISD